MRTKPKIAVVIISKDEPSLNTTIGLLKPQCEKLSASLVVVDASAGRLDWIRKEHPWVIWKDYVKPLGRTFTIPHQRNLGVELAAADIIAYCDSGGTPDPNWLEELTKPIIDRKYRVTSGPIFSSINSIYKVINDEPTGTPISAVLTANFAFEVSAFEEAGGFNEAYDYGSDADFAFRLLDVGISPISVQSARMGMDWGLWSLQKKRSWRYGRARARLLKFNPRRTIEILKSSTIALVYPPLTLLTLFALVDLFFLNFIPLLVVLGLLSVLLWRNRKFESPLQVIFSHFIYTTAMALELIDWLFKRTATVLLLPKDINPYQHRLKDELAAIGTKADFLGEPTKSASVNLLLLPFRLLTARLGGTRIVHLHWTEQFVPKWLANPVGRLFAELWFRFCLSTINGLKLKLVYTVHNLFPHAKVFNNDEKVVKLILRNCAAAVVHHRSTKGEVESLSSTVAIYVIPEGIDIIPNPIKTTKSKTLNIVMLGQIKKYKGIHELLTKITEASKPIESLNIKIAGTCNDAKLKSELIRLVAHANKQGWSIDLFFDYLSHEQMQTLFAESDAALFAFKRITNSGSVRMALGCGVPVVIPNVDSLDYLPNAISIKYEPEAVLDELGNLSKTELESMRKDAYKYAQQYSWQQNAAAHLKMYREVLNGK